MEIGSKFKEVSLSIHIQNQHTLAFYVGFIQFLGQIKMKYFYCEIQAMLNNQELSCLKTYINLDHQC